MPLGLAADFRVDSTTSRFCAPPSWFRGAEGVRSAWPLTQGPDARTPHRSRLKGTPAQRAGIRYERKALAFLQKEFGRDFIPSRWFRYETSESSQRYCQVDGMLQINNLLVVVEIKVTFTSDAWWQLRKLYEPVVRMAMKPSRMALMVVCKSFDPAVPFPEATVALPQVRGIFAPEWDCTKIGVFQWRRG